MKQWAVVDAVPPFTRWRRVLLLGTHWARVGRSLMGKVELLAVVTHKVGGGDLEGEVRTNTGEGAIAIPSAQGGKQVPGRQSKEANMGGH